jgi:leucyl-tRNA synthetase
MERYNFKTVEKKWQNFWDNNKTFVAQLDKNKKNFIA